MVKFIKELKGFDFVSAKCCGIVDTCDCDVTISFVTRTSFWD